MNKEHAYLHVCDCFNRTNISNVSFLNMEVSESLQLLPCISIFEENIEICMLINN